MFKIEHIFANLIRLMIVIIQSNLYEYAIFIYDLSYHNIFIS